MKTQRILVLTLLLFLAACGGEENTPAPMPEPAPEPEPVVARVEKGVQVIHITVGDTGYEPNQIEVQKDLPTRLVFTRTSETTCGTEVHSPDLGFYKTDLPLNEAVEIMVTPDSDGTFTFACGMDMLTGTLVVKS